jgi:non-ribosomal peptide synthetase component F
VTGFCDIFHETVSLYPDKPAIVFKGETVTYSELEKRSFSCAEELRQAGFGAGSVVPVRLGRGAAWLAFTLGVARLGAAYVPLSPAIPKKRLKIILHDAETKLDPGLGAMAIYYTSGSTGEPKGVILTHSNIVAFCKAHLALAEYAPGTRAAVQADVGFDSWVLITLPILLSGGTLYIMEDAERMSLMGIHRFIMKYKAEAAFFTTCLGIEYMRTFDNKYLKTLFVGGEALRSYTPRSYAVWNVYGPAECTVYVTAYRLQPGDGGDIPIGTPLGQNAIEIIDGEICISGPQVSPGYLNRPDETAKRFIKGADGLVRYHTGDLGEWDDNGELRYRGRVDDQVKISGYRIEPGEVEIVMLRHGGIQAAKVFVKERTKLAAWYVPSEKQLAAADLRKHLSESLPEYMIPREFIPLDKIPLDPRTGKVDKTLLL